MEMNLRMGINRKPPLSPTVSNILQSFTEFKVDLHNISIKARKDPTNQWRELPFIAMDDVIFNVLETWLLEWHAPDLVTMDKSATQRKKEEAKLCMVQLAEKRRQKVATTKAQEAREATQTVVE